MGRTGLLKRAIAVVGLLLVLGVAFVLVGSLAPSEKAVSLYEQGRFLESDIYNLAPGEVRGIATQYGRLFAVRPSPEIWANLNDLDSEVYLSEITTYNEELDVFLFWGFADSGERPRCALIYNGDLAPQSKGDWEAAFFDPCTGQQFDFAGRVVKTPFDMKIPNLESPKIKRINAMEFQVLADPAPYTGG